MHSNFVLRKIQSKTQYHQGQHIDSINSSLQQQFLRPSSSESDLQQQIPQFNYVSSKLLNPKSKPSFTTPFNKYIDKESLIKEHSNKKSELLKLNKINKELREKYKQNTLLRRQLEQALFKLSEALPSSSDKQSYFIVKQKQGIEVRNIETKQELMKLKRSSKATYKQQFNILKQYLKSHTQRLNQQLEYQYHQHQQNQKAKQRQNKQRRRRTIEIQAQEVKYLQTVDKIQSIKNQWMINLKCNLLNQKLQQDNSSIKLKEARIKNTIQEIKKKKQLLQKIKMENAGLSYQQQIFIQNKQTVPSIEQEIEQLKISSLKKQKIVSDLRTTLTDRTNVHQYVKKWNEDLKQKLEEKKKSEQIAKSTLQSRINSLSKQFEEWNSKCKTLVMQDQAMKLGRNNRQFKINSKFNHQVKARMIKEYEVEGIFKRINYQLCLQQVSKQTFIKNIVGDKQICSAKQIYQSLKNSYLLDDKYHQDYLKLSKYIIEDSTKQAIHPNDFNQVETKKAKLILSNMIGHVLSRQDFSIENKRIVSLMKKDYWNIREKLPLTDMISEERLRESFLFLGKQFQMTTFKAICLKMFEFDKNELNKYPLSSFKVLFEKLSLKKSQSADVIDTYII